MQLINTNTYNATNGERINHQLNPIVPVPFSTANTNESKVQIIRDALEKYIIFLSGAIIHLILYDIRILLLIHHRQAEQ